MRVYIGTYTSEGGEGIYLYQFSEAGELSFSGHIADAENPSFLAVSPSGKYLYATHESVGEGNEPGVSAFAINASGELTWLNRQASGGDSPCYIAVSPDENIVAAANYGGGSVAAFALKNDGRLGERTALHQHEGSGPNAGRQEKAFAHSIVFDDAGHFAFSADLGADKIYTYRVDSEKKTLLPLDEVSVHAGAGPRHLVLDAARSRAYVVNELDSTVSTHDYDAATGHLRERDFISTLPADFSGENTCAEIKMAPSGRFLYASNRGHDSIAIFAIDENDGHLTSLGHAATQGKTPRNFALHPSGKWMIVANQESNSLVVFAVDAESGALSPTGQTLSVPAPVCVLFAVAK